MAVGSLSHRCYFHGACGTRVCVAMIYSKMDSLRLPDKAMCIYMDNKTGTMLI